MCRFRRNFQDTHWVQAPKVHWGHTTRNIITLEYLPGTKISDTTALMAAGGSCFADAICQLAHIEHDATALGWQAGRLALH